MASSPADPDEGSVVVICEQLGDGVTAKMHLEAAASIFERLGAAPDLARLQTGAALRGGAAAELSGREQQVLALAESGTIYVFETGRSRPGGGWKDFIRRLLPWNTKN